MTSFSQVRVNTPPLYSAEFCLLMSMAPVRKCPWWNWSSFYRVDNRLLPHRQRRRDLLLSLSVKMVNFHFHVEHQETTLPPSLRSVDEIVERRANIASKFFSWSLIDHIAYDGSFDLDIRSMVSKHVLTSTLNSPFWSSIPSHFHLTDHKPWD